jgi:Asp-tRNA(Asn)/Glu-tRNA(Gln) amidotransferase A subunit family amidase
MLKNPLHRARQALLLIAASLLLCACTRVDLAYRNLDVIVPWTMGDYLDMNREQKGWFNERLKEHLRWHCAAQLPANLAWLDKLEQMVASDRVNDAELITRTAEAKQAIAEVAKEVTPSAVQLLQGLDDNQVRAMRQSFADDLRKRRAEFVEPPLAKQASDRAKRMQKRLLPWFGTLNEAQAQRIDAWSQGLGQQNRQWIDNREHWQGLFLAAVQQRQSADFPNRLAQLLQQREQLWTPEYKAAFSQTETATRQLLIGLIADSTPAQRQQIQQKLRELRQDFKELKCMQAANPG